MSSTNNAIDEKTFRATLSERFIELIDSERGLQSKLAETIGKRPSFIGEVKRGKPVNALHLKAVELVFGPTKVIELLSIDKKEITSQNIVDFLPHPDLVNEFQQKELARELNLNAIKLERVQPEGLKEINEFIKFKLQTIENSATGEAPAENAQKKKRANGQ